MCMRPRSCAAEKRVRRTLVLRPCSGIRFRRDTAVWYCAGTGRRRRLRAAPPPDDLKIDSTHCGGNRILAGTVRCETVRS